MTATDHTLVVLAPGTYQTLRRVNRPNAVGETGALERHGDPESPVSDWERI